MATPTLSKQTYTFETLAVTWPSAHVANVILNRPNQRNAMNNAFWTEMRTCFETLAQDDACRAILLTGKGPVFSAGLDLSDLPGPLHPKAAAAQRGMDVARRALGVRAMVLHLQGAFKAIERCPKPCLAAIHGVCMGGGVDLVTACDMRYCTQDATFHIKEVDIGLAADLGTLQRAPHLMGHRSALMELALTGRPLPAAEAARLGLVSRVLPDRDALWEAALSTATCIARKSPIAVMGTKHLLLRARDAPAVDGGSEAVSGLGYVALWNAALLLSEDIKENLTAATEKRPPKFKNAKL